ncbi:MAG: hypothetical protein ABS75_09255 [Pelagibacterium sp. SCN 63-23]|nr:MAG: hypothetical protein ABS75_09255 [Pelagibacterium sp. SCN 63-23]
MVTTRLPLVATILFSATAPLLAADMALDPRRSTKPATGQCQGFFDRPITNDMLPAMHDAGCCDMLVTMYETAAVNALERRLMCPAWHHYKMLYGAPAEELEHLESVDVPPDLIAVVIPPQTEDTPDEPQPPLPLPTVQVPAQPVTIPWTMMTAPAEFPEDVPWPEGYVPGPLTFGP